MTGWLGGLAGWLGGLASWLCRSGWLALGLGWLLGGMDGCIDGQTENIPILQDFVPYPGRYPRERVNFETLPGVVE